MEYSTTQTNLRMRQYGRHVQMMVQEAMQIPDREARLTFCRSIVRLMAKFADRSIRPENLENCLWNHLAIISDYKLDIDYPCPIIPQEVATQHQPIPYPQTRIRRRHYGHLVEQIAQQLSDQLLPQERANLILLMATRMKRNLSEYRADISNIDKIAEDIAYYTEGRVTPDEVKKVCAKRIF